MRNLIAIALLVVYVIAWLKPYAPYMEYALNHQYIARELCKNKSRPAMACQGKCYFRKRLQKAAQEEQSSSPVTSTKKVQELVVLLGEFTEMSLCTRPFLFENQFSETNPWGSFLAVDPPTPPPKLLFVV